jgi:hypothetical protein
LLAHKICAYFFARWSGPPLRSACANARTHFHEEVRVSLDAVQTPAHGIDGDIIAAQSRQHCQIGRLARNQHRWTLRQES